jgi:23S rRNA (uracil1939-C5)-methyltransferase
MPNPMLDVEIDAQAYGGEALGRAPDGRRVFVRGALPGERVRVQVTEDRRSYLRGQVAQVLRAAEARIAPRCVHFGDCGGCHYQHMHYEAQLGVKADVLREQLQRLGGIDVPPLAAPLASPAEWNYRNHVQFSLAPDGRLGYMRPASRAVLPIRVCHLPEPPLDEIWPRLDLRESLGLHQVGLRRDTEGEAMIVLEGGAAALPEVEVEGSLSVAWLSPSGAAHVLAGDDALRFSVCGRDFEVSPGSFFQVNTYQVPRLVELVLTLAEVRPGDTALDVYSGVGLFSAFIAAAGARVIAVEVSSSAAADFEVNLEEFEGVELYEASAAQVLPQLQAAPQVVVVDPPRAGMEREAMAGLLRLAPPRVVYVSCDPSTLARDGRTLRAAGYDLATVIPIDLFPQTYHIESVSLWRRA